MMKIEQAFSSWRLSGVVALTFLGSGISIAYGQNQPVEEHGAQGRALEEVIVSARRVEESQQDVPLAITAMSGNMLEQQGVFKVEDLTTNIPSFNTYSPTGRKTTLRFMIRGQQPLDVVLTADPAVGIYIADVVQMRTHGLGVSAFLDVRSVEVVKGPQGTLFGRNTTGGAVLIHPNTPDEVFAAKLWGGFGWENRRNVGGMLNLPITRTLGVRVAVENTTQYPTIDDRGSQDGFYDADQQSWRASLRWDATDSLTTTFFTDGMRGKDNGATSFIHFVDRNGLVNNLYGNDPAGADPVSVAEFLTGLDVIDSPAEGGFERALQEQRQSDFYSTRVNEGAFTDTQNTGVSNTTEYQLNDTLSLKNIIGYRRVKQDEAIDLDGTPFPALSTVLNFEVDQVTEEIQLIGEWEKFNFITGIFYFEEDGFDVSKASALEGSLFEDAGLVSNPALTGGEVTNESRSVFVQGTYRLTPQWSLTLGGRWTEDRREVVLESRDPSGCRLEGVEEGQPCRKALSEDFSEPTWNVSVEWAFAESQLAYLAHRHGYRSGGFNIRGLNEAELQPFDQEIVEDIEVGYKSDFNLGNQSIRFNAAAYYQDYTDIQRAFTIVGSDGQPRNIIDNVAAATIWGGELELTWSPVLNLLVTGFYSLTNASYDEWTTPDGEDLSDNDFRAVPEHTGKLSIRYTWPSPVWGDISGQFGAYSQSDATLWITEEPGTHQGGYTLYETRLDWQEVLGSALSLSVWGKNLTDKEYRSGALAIPQLGYTAGYHGTPRSWGVDFKYQFPD